MAKRLRGYEFLRGHLKLNTLLYLRLAHALMVCLCAQNEGHCSNGKHKVF